MSILSKIITTPKVQILVIGGLSEDAFDISISLELDNTMNLAWMIKSEKDKDDDGLHYIQVLNILPGNWEVLGKLNEITGEKAALVVGRYFDNYKVCQKLNQQPQYDMFWVQYPNGEHKHFDTKDECYEHALQKEVQHLIESNVKLKNNRPECTCELYTKEFESCPNINKSITNCSIYQEWEVEQSEVFTNPFIMIKK